MLVSKRPVNLRGNPVFPSVTARIPEAIKDQELEGPISPWIMGFTAVISALIPTRCALIARHITTRPGMDPGSECVNPLF